MGFIVITGVIDMLYIKARAKVKFNPPSYLVSLLGE